MSLSLVDLASTDTQCRRDFENDALQSAKERLQTLVNHTSIEEATLIKLQGEKEAVMNEISNTEAMIESLQEDLGGLQATLEEKTKELEQVKKITLKASKALENAVKDITLRASSHFISCLFFSLIDDRMTSSRNLA